MKSKFTVKQQLVAFALMAIPTISMAANTAVDIINNGKTTAGAAISAMPIIAFLVGAVFAFLFFMDLKARGGERGEQEASVLKLVLEFCAAAGLLSYGTSVLFFSGTVFGAGTGVTTAF